MRRQVQTRDGLALKLMAIYRHDPIYSPELRAPRQIQPQLSVHGEIEIRIGKRRAADDRASHEDCWLRDEVVGTNRRLGERWRPQNVQQGSLGIHEGGMTVNQPDAGVVVEYVHGSFDDVAGEVRVVGVEPADDLAPARAEGFADGVRLAPIGLAEPAYVRAGFCLEDGNRPVGRAPVHH